MLWRRCVCVLGAALACDGTYGRAGGAADAAAMKPGSALSGAEAVAKAASADGIGGVFSASPGISTFRPCGLDEAWWPEGLDLYASYRAAGAQDLVPAYVRVRGEVSERGHYGHFNAYDREIHVTALLELRGLKEDECR